LDLDQYQDECKERLLLYTREEYLTEEIKVKWETRISVGVFYRHGIKRGNFDKTVPPGYVSPTLFSKDQERTMYTLVQALNVEELNDEWIRLLDLSVSDSLVIKGSSKMYRQMICELRDWNHPCHKPQKSALAFLREWLRAYC